MRLYTNNQGAWTGTIADAKRDYGKNVVMIEVPTSKEALMKWLNNSRVVSQADVAVSEFVAKQTTVVDDAAIVQATPPTHKSSTPFTLFEAAKGASLRDLQHVVYRYLERIDDEFDLRRTGKE